MTDESVTSDEWLTVAQAMEATHKSDSTMRRFIKRSLARDGDVTRYIRRDEFGYLINKKYLFDRLMTRRRVVVDDQPVTSSDQSVTSDLVAVLQLENERLYKQLESKDLQISSMLEREKERNVLLGHQQGIKPLGLEADTKKPRRLSWWRRG
jgi:hypothetical protein